MKLAAIVENIGPNGELPTYGPTTSADPYLLDVIEEHLGKIIDALNDINDAKDRTTITDDLIRSLEAVKFNASV